MCHSRLWVITESSRKVMVPTLDHILWPCKWRLESFLVTFGTCTVLFCNSTAEPRALILEGECLRGRTLTTKEQTCCLWAGCSAVGLHSLLCAFRTQNTTMSERRVLAYIALMGTRSSTRGWRNCSSVGWKNLCKVSHAVTELKPKECSLPHATSSLSPSSHYPILRPNWSSSLPWKLHGAP